MKRDIIRFFKSVLPPKVWAGLKKITNRILLFTWTDVYFYYDADYVKGALKDMEWVEGFCNAIKEIFHPSSVVDFGCGIGVILHYFEKNGIDVFGIDGSAMSRRYSIMKKGNFLLYDLRRRMSLEKRYDLCLCLEVAEHIEERYSDILIGNLVRHGSTVIFSAAPPFQPADCHFNLKPYEWWIEKFRKYNFEFHPQLTDAFKKRIKDIPKIPGYYVNNILVFQEAPCHEQTG